MNTFHGFFGHTPSTISSLLFGASVGNETTSITGVTVIRLYLAFIYGQAWRLPCKPTPPQLVGQPPEPDNMEGLEATLSISLPVHELTRIQASLTAFLYASQAG